MGNGPDLTNDFPHNDRDLHFALRRAPLDRRTMTEIPPFKLIPEPLTEEAADLAPFKWADPDVGSRHRLGGEPSLLQRAEYPSCADCGQTMIFYGQLDSINDDYVLGDVGLVFVFICFDCFTSTSFIRSG